MSFNMWTGYGIRSEYNVISVACVEMASVCWHYYMSKIIDLLDTSEVIRVNTSWIGYHSPSTHVLVFFVLRKKNNQITPLHLVHHFGMPFLGFVCVRFFP
ncbi:unnamed protein product, partial [Timema podura]|nr:unnamed protein product [Timema podura]